MKLSENFDDQLGHFHGFVKICYSLDKPSENTCILQSPQFTLSFALYPLCNTRTPQPMESVFDIMIHQRIMHQIVRILFQISVKMPSRKFKVISNLNISNGFSGFRRDYSSFLINTE